MWFDSTITDQVDVQTGLGCARQWVWSRKSAILQCKSRAGGPTIISEDKKHSDISQTSVFTKKGEEEEDL